MKGIKLLLFLLLITETVVLAQDPGSVSAEQIAEREKVYAEANRNSRKDEQVNRPPSRLPKLKTKLTKEEEARVRPNETDLAANREFLSQRNTGIFKIYSFQNCNVKLIDVSDLKCLEALHIVGNGSFYSISRKSHNLDVFSDVYFANGLLVVGYRSSSLGLIRNLGNIPIEAIDRSSAKILDLIAFQSPKQMKLEDKLEVQSKAVIVPGDTLAVRIMHFPVSYDRRSKRKDNLYVFKVVSRNAAEESITVIWKKV